jgi:hypothetical protein
MRLLVGLGLGMLAWGCAAAVSVPKSQPTAAEAPAPVFKRGLSFGTADPYTLLGFDPEAQWVALCQAREDTDGDGITRVGFFHHGEASGDAMKTYFVLGGGEGEVIDGYLGRAASGAWVALRKGQRVYLLDTRTGAERELAQVNLDKEADPSPAGGIRTLAFSPAKEQLLLVQESKAGRASVALMDLATGELRQIDLGAGRVWQAGFSDDGTWIQAALVTADRNGNGRLDLPTLATTLRGDACGQPAAYSTWGLEKEHDEILSVAVPVAGGKVRPVPEVQGTLDGDLVLLRDDGTLVRENAAGAQQRLAGPKCGAGVLDYYSLEYERWLVACRPSARPTPEPNPPTFGGVVMPVARTEMWVFGKGLPDDGRPIGVTLAYGAEPGAFGTERYSRLVTEEGTLLFDLKELDIEKVPEGYEPCARSGASYLLQPEPERDDEAKSTPSGGVMLWSPGAAPTPLVAATRCTGLEGGRQVLLDSWIFDWQARKVIGTVEPICPEGDCSSLSYAPFSSRQGFLLNRAPAPSRSAAALERKLRESLGGPGARSYAESGPVSFQGWTAPEVAPAPRPKPPRTPLNQALLRDPSPSCEPVASAVRTQPSALPSWTEPHALGGTAAQFPRPSYTNDDQPTYEYLQRQLCSARDLSFAFEGVEQALEASSKLPEPEDSFDPTLLPATWGLKSLLRQCSPADTCRHAIALADSAYQHLKGKLAPELLLACDARSIGNRFEQLHAEPLLQLEWLVAGEGHEASNAAQLQAPLERALASKDEDDVERAIMLVASDQRRGSAQLLLATRAHLGKQPLTMLTETPTGPAEVTFGTEQFDLLLGPSKDARLKKLHRAACARLPQDEVGSYLDDDRCKAAKPGGEPTHVELRYLDPERAESVARVATLPELLGGAAAQTCARAFSGVCPDLPMISLRTSQSGIWSALYQAALAAARLPGSPLASGLLDTPLRMTHGKLEATWRIWLDGRVYELGPGGIARASLDWANAQKSPISAEVLAVRGLLAWLNGVAAERGASQRFFFAKHSIDGYLLMATPEQACALSSSEALLISQEPTWFEPSR